MDINKILLGILNKEIEAYKKVQNNITPEEKVYLIAKAIKDSGRPIDADLWYAILELKDKNFPTIGNDIDYFTKSEE